MIDYHGLFRFAAPLCTGEHWFMEAMKAVGFEASEQSTESDNRGLVYEIFEDAPQPSENSLRVSLVRHPCHWIAHAYQIVSSPHVDDLSSHIMRTKLLGLDTDTFHSFVNSYLSVMPGAVGRYFNRYECDTRMRYEDQPWALIELLDSLKISPSWRNSVLSTPLPSTSLVKWNPRLREQVLRSEKELCESCDYY